VYNTVMNKMSDGGAHSLRSGKSIQQQVKKALPNLVLCLIVHIYKV
jgi:hypothetical protein